MNSLRALTLLLVLPVGSGCAAAPAHATRSVADTSQVTRTGVDAGFERVAFLVGDWDGASVGGRFDEHWIPPRGGLMLGVGREIDAKGTSRFFELLRIERRGSDLVLVPHPMGKPAQDFRLVRASPGSAVFENAGDDRVVRISYSVEGSELVARVEYRGDGHIDEVRMRRASR